MTRTIARTIKLFFLISAVCAAVFLIGYSIGLFSKDALGHSALGNDHLEKKQYRAAISDYKKSLFLNKKNANALVNIAYAYSHVDRFADAARSYEAAFQLDQKDERIIVSAALCYARANMDDKADRVFTCAEELFPAIPAVSFEHVKYCIRHKKWVEARELSSGALRRFASYAEPFLFAAVVKIHENRLQEAYRLCRNALERDPSNEQARTLLVRLEKVKARPAKDPFFYSPEEDQEFHETVSSLMREGVTLNQR